MGFHCKIIKNLEQEKTPGNGDPGAKELKTPKETK